MNSHKIGARLSLDYVDWAKYHKDEGFKRHIQRRLVKLLSEEIISIMKIEEIDDEKVLLAKLNIFADEQLREYINSQVDRVIMKGESLILLREESKDSAN